MVEFALMAPLLVLILLLIVDLGWVFRELQILENAAREGARFSAEPRNQIGSTPTATADRIKQVVIGYCSQENISVQAADITVSQSVPLGPALVGSQVTVSYQRAFLIPGTGLLPTGQMTLVGRAVFRNLY